MRIKFIFLLNGGKQEVTLMEYLKKLVMLLKLQEKFQVGEEYVKLF